MTSLEVTILQPLVANVIARRAGSGASAPAIAAAARRVYDELAAVLVPIISQAGADALIARAFHVTKRRYPDQESGEEPAEPFGAWLDRQDPDFVLGAASATLATFAELLASLIGETLTTRYLRKAWTDGFPDAISGDERR